MAINLWIAFSNQALTAFRERRTDENNGDEYDGPMDDLTFKLMSYMSDQEVVSGLYNTPTVSAKTYNMFSIYLPPSKALQEAIDEVTAAWPAHIIVLAAWQMDGRLAGTQWELDQDGERTGNTTGVALYPPHAQSWRLMPDVVVYDPETGDVVSTTPSTSNSDLRDINLLAGQASRRFA